MRTVTLVVVQLTSLPIMSFSTTLQALDTS
jgi:hypothetical protein